MSAESLGFTSYLDKKKLPCTAVSVRHLNEAQITLALVDHLPAPGCEYPPVDDLIVSIVVRSNRGMVERDVGCGRQVFREGPNSILVTPPRTPSYWSFSGTPQVIHIAIAGSQVDAFYSRHSEAHLPGLRDLSKGPISDPLLAMLATRTWLASGDNTGLGQIVAEGAANLVLPCLLKQDLPALQPRTTAGTCLAPWRYKRAALLLRQLDTRYSLEQIAEELGLSVSHFVRAFKATTGKSPHQWLSAERIDQAKQLLRTSDLSAIEIATTLGYSSASHFSSAFRAATGISPRAWRSAFLLANARHEL